jgi:hypothetical protein
VGGGLCSWLTSRPSSRAVVFTMRDISISHILQKSVKPVRELLLGGSVPRTTAYIGDSKVFRIGGHTWMQDILRVVVPEIVSLLMQGTNEPDIRLKISRQHVIVFHSIYRWIFHPRNGPKKGTGVTHSRSKEIFQRQVCLRTCCIDIQNMGFVFRSSARIVFAADAVQAVVWLLDACSCSQLHSILR